MSIHGPCPHAIRRSAPADLLECLCGNFGQEVLRQRSCHMVNSERLVDILRFRRGVAALGRIERRLHQRRQYRQIRAGRARKAATATSLAALRTVGAAPPGLQRPAAERQRRKADPDRAPRRSSVPIWARSSRAAGPSIRVGQARQWAIGMRMSGEPSCATTEPSRYSTMP